MAVCCPTAKSLGVKIQAVYSSGVVSIVLYREALTFGSLDEMLRCDLHTVEYVHMVLFIMLHKVVLTFEFEVEILKCGH